MVQATLSEKIKKIENKFSNSKNKIFKNRKGKILDICDFCITFALCFNGIRLF